MTTITSELITVPKPEYQWQYWSNPGRAKLGKTDSMKLRSNYMFRLAIALVLATALALDLLVSKASGVTGSMAGWVAGKGQQLFSASAPKTDPAPHISLPAPMVPFRGQTDVQFAPFADVINEMRRLTTDFSGKAPEGCLTTAQITEGWWTSSEATPRCRLSGDGERLWVWAVVADGRGTPARYMSLIRKNDGKNELFNVQIGYGSLAIQGVETLNPMAIPRTFAHDFPELGGAK